MKHIYVMKYLIDVLYCIALMYCLSYHTFIYSVLSLDLSLKLLRKRQYWLDMFIGTIYR